MIHMAAVGKTPEGGAVVHWESRIHTALATGRRQFVHQWTAPRSPVLQLALLPLFLVVALLMLAVALLLFVIMLAFFVAAVMASRFGLLRRRG